uniref:Uncharacterized protein n=2 Tax=Sphaerodactylus townsendi TaxID=933632 RepID=A0ACB8FVF0_9SAUR
MRALVALIALLGSLLLFLCLVWLSAEGSLSARGWEKEVKDTTDAPPPVMRSLQVPFGSLQLAPQTATNR